jgi:uncharacterized SAM-binding protein YcdF (DUF218 family)
LAGSRRSSTPQSAYRSRPVRSRKHTPRRKQFPLPVRLSFAAISLLAALLVWAVVGRAVAPRANSTRQTFDAIVVLGTPADSDGNPTPELLDRIGEGVREYERGIAPRLIVTGAAAHNQFVEAEVMSRVAQAQGVPASVIFEEPQALDTIQNACYSDRILKAHGWHSAEIVSSSSHLPRAALIFSHLPGEKLEFRTHAAPGNLSPGYYSSAASIVETVKTARYLVWSRWVESCTP